MNGTGPIDNAGLNLITRVTARIENHDRPIKGDLQESNFVSSPEQVLDREQIVSAAGVVGKAIEVAFSAPKLSFELIEVTDQVVVQLVDSEAGEVIKQFPPEELVALAEFMELQNPEMFTQSYLKGLIFDRSV
jgi:uncharacterized FlaG/YvyC family protein